MKESLLRQRTEADFALVDGYCRAIGWNTERMLKAFHSIGLSNEETYLEAPNTNLIHVLSEFLSVLGSPLMLIYGENGMGKSAIKEFCMRVFKDDNRFFIFSIDNPGPFTPAQLIKTICTTLTEQPAPNRKEQVMAAIEESLITYRQKGITTVIWIDEGQSLSVEKIDILRNLADIKTPEGDLTCKIIIIGTKTLEDHIKAWIDKYPEKMGAFDDRSSFTAITLERWTAQHVYSWYTLLAEYAAENQTNIVQPFSQKLAFNIHKLAEGKPRSIIQLSQIAFNDKAREFDLLPKSSIEITQKSLQNGMAPRLPAGA